MSWVGKSSIISMIISEKISIENDSQLFVVCYQSMLGPLWYR